MSRTVRNTHRRVSVPLALAAIAAASLPVVAHAQGLALPDLGDLIPKSFQSLGSAVNVVWNTVVGVGGLAFLGYLLYGGFMFLTSAGDEALATKARHTLRDAVIGIALVVLAWPIGVMVLTILGQQGIITDNPGLNAPTAGSSSTLFDSTPTPTPTPKTDTTAPASRPEPAPTTETNPAPTFKDVPLAEPGTFNPF